MADAVLLRRAELGGAGVETARREHRVVAEAVVAAWRGEDASRPGARADHRHRVEGMTQVDHHADEAGAATVVVDAVQRLEQARHVVGVADPLAGIAGRAHPRRTVQRLDLQPRVVGDGGQAGAGGGGAGLLQGILDEGRCILDYRRQVELGLRHQFEPTRGENGGDLPQLAGIAAGQDHPGHVASPPARRAGCASASPRPARRGPAWPASRRR